jgi:HlyD family secretion protein
MKKIRNIAVIAGIVVLLLSACGGTGQAQFETVAAAKGSLSATVGATGTVRSNQSADLAWQTTGTVDQVQVKAGERVKTGETLATLQMTSLPQNVILAEASLLSAQQTLDDLKTSGVSQAKAEQALADAQKAFDDAKTKYDGIYFQRASDTYIKNTQAQLDLANNQVSQARKFYALFSHLDNGDSRKAEALAGMTSAELRRDQLVAQLNYVTGKPNATDSAQRKADYEVAKAQLTAAQKDLERLQNGVDPVELASAEAQVTAAQATLNLARIVAPFDATVTDVQPLAGDQVSPGQVAFRLDDVSRLLVDVEVSEIDINAIQPKQPVDVSFDAILGKSYKGVVTDVSQVGTVVQGAVNFAVTVELTNADAAVKPGMTAAVTILVKQLNDVLIVPNRAVRVVDNNRVVYVLKNGLPTAVKIRLGSTSDTDSEVVGGDLKLGDLIVLNPPAVFGGSGGGPSGNPGDGGGG